MIQLSSLSKSYGERVLLDAVTWQIDDRERVALCGPNGAGKTTLLKMLAGLEEPDAGGVVMPASLTIGYLPQDGLVHKGRTVFGEASLAFAPLLAMKEEIHSLEERMGAADATEDAQAAMLDRYAELSDRFRLAEGYTIDLQVATVLHGLGFSKDDFDRPADTFSGGWQMRIALAKLLLGRPGLLLLDEPTNHLDLDARNWLESYLREYPHAVILVSHDRFFLDAVVTKIADLNLRTITDYHGNYSDYLVERDARLERLRAAKKDQDDEVARIKMFVDRFRYQATKAAQVQSRIKLLEKVVPIEVPPERKRVHFTFPAAPKSGRMVLELKHVRKTYGALTVFDNLSMHIERGDRIALVGPNGAGKSTLMRMLSGEEAPDHGDCVAGHQVIAEYFAQDEATRLTPTLTVYETLSSGSPMHMVPAIRNILGGFLFSGDDVYKKAGVLSGGERTRLAVARMLLRPVEPAAAGRTDQPPRSRLEGRPARRARRLRRHAHLRESRPLLRRTARDADHRRRARQGRVVPGDLPGVPVAERASECSIVGGPGSQRRRREGAKARRAEGDTDSRRGAPCAPRAGAAGRREKTGCREGARVTPRPACRARRPAQARSGAEGAQDAALRPRNPDRVARNCDQGARSGDVDARVL